MNRFRLFGDMKIGISIQIKTLCSFKRFCPIPKFQHLKLQPLDWKRVTLLQKEQQRYLAKIC